ncbi:hypothetical protein AK812_SmicGene27498 [Symbiodinium microadriaticum]|uniref:Uncharacterized protein n=1 Tax=Symbiodinium microadriaticum TaxID=2951 RepID=A0A1Q9D6P1_SYMMI|nr:hypothetical protein AK812_SmicGene27498 [Symbiodinium microadriaticum]
MRLAAIRAEHLTVGLPNPLAQFPRIPLVLDGIKRKYPALERRHPVTPAMLLAAAELLQHERDGLVILLALLLGFFFLLRASELIGDAWHGRTRGLRGCDVSLLRGGKPCPVTDLSEADELRIFIQSSKTDIYNAGATRNHFATGLELCPVRAAIQVFQLYPQRYLGGSEQDDHLLRGEKGDLLTRQFLQLVLQQCAERVGDSPSLIKVHSLRFGGASALWSRYQNAELIKRCRFFRCVFEELASGSSDHPVMVPAEESDEEQAARFWAVFFSDEEGDEKVPGSVLAGGVTANLVSEGVRLASALITLFGAEASANDVRTVNTRSLISVVLLIERDTHAEELEETKHLLVVAQCRESALQQQVAGLQAELAAADKATLALKAELDLARHQADSQELSPSASERGQDPAVVKLKMKMHTAQEVQATAIGELHKELQSSREELEMERSERAKQTVLVSDLQKKLRKSEEDLRFYRKQEAELRGQQRERKLSSQEVQAMRAHLQSLQRRSQEEEPSGEAFEKQLKEMTRKIKDSSPSRSSPARSHRPVLDQLEQAAEASLSRSEKSPKPGSDRSPSGPAMSQRSQVLHSPLRRPSTVALAGAGDLHSTESAQTLTFEDFKVLGPPQPQLPAPTQVLAAPQPQRHVLAPPQALPLPTPAETLSSNMFLAPSQGLSPEPTLGGLPFWLPADLSAQPFAPVLETPPHASSVHLPVGSPSNFSGQLLAPASNGPMLGSWLPTTSSRTAATPERPSSRHGREFTRFCCGLLEEVAAPFLVIYEEAERLFQAPESDPICVEVAGMALVEISEHIRLKEARATAIRSATAVAAPTEGGRKLPAKEDLIGMRWVDDRDLNEMLDTHDVCPADPEGEDLVVMNRDDIPKDHLPVSGRNIDHIGRWLIADQLSDASIATQWYSNEGREDMGDAAAYAPKAFLCQREYPPRFYHRTTHDAGVTRDAVPGTCIIYVRDAAENESMIDIVCSTKHWLLRREEIAGSSISDGHWYVTSQSDASFQSQRKRMKTTRGFAEAAPAAVVSPNLTRDSGARGLQSPDSAVLEKAKQMLKLAQKHGYDTIVARFDNDVQYTVHSTSNGFDREFLRNEDILVKGALPKTKGLSVLEPTDPGGVWVWVWVWVWVGDKQRNAELARIAQAKADAKFEADGYGKGSHPFSRSGVTASFRAKQQSIRLYGRLPPNRASPARLTRAQAGTRLAGQGLSREPIVPI